MRTNPYPEPLSEGEDAFSTSSFNRISLRFPNFTFFRETRNWFKYLNRRKKKGAEPARFYMLDCVDEAAERCAHLRRLDPLLEDYESEYHYLFATIYHAAKAATPGALNENYVFPNMARRLLEAFLAFRQPQTARGLWQKLKQVGFDEAKKLRIYQFVQTHSHGETIGEPEHDPSLLGEARAVLKDLLDLIESQDPEHFLAMVKLVDGLDEGETDDLTPAPGTEEQTAEGLKQRKG